MWRGAGLAIPGGEKRSQELDWEYLSRELGVKLYRGTFNIQLNSKLPDSVFSGSGAYLSFAVRPCSVTTEARIKKDLFGFGGWAIRFVDEKLPKTFIEVISQHHLRKELGMQNHPGFNAELTVF